MTLRTLPRTLTSVFLVVALAAGASVVAAGKFNKSLDIGDKAPAWEKLEGVDGEEYSLDSFKKSKAIVVVFTCNTCPVAVNYEERINKFAREYKSKQVEVVAINANANGGNSLEAMRKRAKDKGFKFVYLRAPDKKLVKAYGATVTPHFFLLDGERKIAYMGAYDNDQFEKKAVGERENYLADAVDAVLAGEKPKKQETRQFGCGIK